MANPTTNYGWPMPTSTDLVTDLPADFAAFGQPVDTSLKALNPETTLGDLAYRSATANTNTRLGIGTSGQVLGISGGVPAWVAPPAAAPVFVGCSLWKSPAQSLSNATDTTLTWENEEFDTNTFHSTSTNTSRITIPTGYAGKYLISATIAFAGSAVGNRKIYFFKNGGTLALNAVFDNAGADATRQSTSVVAELAVADYIEVSCQQNSGGSLDVNAGQSSTRFSIVYLGA